MDVIFWFALGYWYEGDQLKTARFHSHDRTICEAVYKTCHEGRVKLPVKRNDETLIESYILIDVMRSEINDY